MTVWATSKLGEVAYIVMGQSPPGETYNTDGRGLPFFQGKAEFGDEHPQTQKWCDAPLKVAETGDVLISVRAPVGPTNVASERCCIGRGLAAIRPKGGSLAPRFLRYFFKAFESQIARQGAGSTFDAIGRSVLEGLEIPLPPFPEQERIARILDEAEVLRRLRVQADERTDLVRFGIFVAMFGDPLRNGTKWPIRSLGEICGPSGIKAGPFGSSLKKESYTATGPRVYGQEQVIAGDFGVGDYHISDEKFAEMRAYVVRTGDVLISLVGTIGRAVVVPEGIEPGIINPRLLRIRPPAGIVSAEFLVAILTSRSATKFFATVAGGITMGVLNAALLKDLRVIVPPIQLQEEYSACVAKIRELEAAQTTSRERLDQLFESLLQRAFRGEL